MSVSEQTIDTYDRHARNFAQYFRSVSAGREEDIAEAWKLFGDKPNPNVVEIGCGDGRDATIILEHTKNYIGFDPSKGLIDLARKNLPNSDFRVGDAVSFDYGKGVDVVFAFASLIHVSKQDVAQVCQKVHLAMSPGSIFYLSLKGTDSYHEFLQDGKLGKRLFYFYHPDDIRSLADGLFEEVYFKDGFVTNGAENWFEMALKKL